MPMPLGFEFQFPTSPLLNFFQIGPPDFLDAAAKNTDQVIVVGAFEIEFKSRGPFGTFYGADKSAFRHHLKRAKHRSASDAAALERLINIFKAFMLVAIEQIIKNLFSLIREPKAMR